MLQERREQNEIKDQMAPQSWSILAKFMSKRNISAVKKKSTLSQVSYCLRQPLTLSRRTHGSSGATFGPCAVSIEPLQLRRTSRVSLLAATLVPVNGPSVSEVSGSWNNTTEFRHFPCVQHMHPPTPPSPSPRGVCLNKASSQLFQSDSPT